ncbi:MAG: PQQ-binding-like beta-propeller repeat protein, partial [Phycisphaerae bacterium]
KTGLDEGLVQNELDDEFKPVYDPNGDDNCNIKNSESFRQWYRDTEGVNLSKQIELVLTYDPSSNTYVFSDNEFFPIDGELWDNQNLSPNYHFTLELQTAFEYVEPSAESRDFKIFKSDDDLWVFIERHDDRKPVLVLDLGGLHTGRCAYFRFENGNAYITRYYDTSSCEPLPGETEVPLGLQEGEIYNLYLFFAERHTIHSNLHFWTTLKLDTQCIPGDYRLQAGSPCIDAGDNTAVPIGITTDIDGLSRFVDDPDTPDTGNRDAGDSRAYVDIGAYEFQSNLPPIAAAGENQTHYVCGSDEWVYITLDGSGSTDPDSGNPPDDDDDIVSYIWSWIENSEEITVEGKIVEVTMTAQYSPYTVTLTVTDSSGSSDTDTMQIFINSSANPIADIGSSPMTVIDGGPQDSDGSVNGRAEVTLDASGSSGANLIYMWQYKGQIIAQGYEDTAKTITTRFGIGTHNIILYVIDQCGNWDFAEMQVIVQWPPPSSPSIDAGPNQEFNLPLPDDVVISLKGEVVFDPAGQIANFLWKLVDKPAGGYAVLDSSMSLETDIIEISEDIHGEYRFMLYGLDSDYNEVAKDSTSVILKSTTRSNQQPIVDAWIVSGSNKLKEQFVYENNITIKGNVSDDGQPKGNLTARWRQISGPLNGLTVTPLAESCSNRCKNLEITSEIMFAENGYGTYQLALYASDGILYGRDIIAVHYTSSLPPLVNAGGNKFAVMAGAYVDVKMDDAYVIDREYPFDDTVKEWTLIQGNAANIVFLDSQGLPNGDTSSDENPIIRFYANGQYQFQLKATEAGKAPVTDTVYVTISQEPVEIIDEWPMFHHNTARTGYSNSRAPNKKNILWIFETNQNVDHGDKVMTFSSPAVVGGVVYIGISYVGYGAPQNKGYLFAIDAFSGDLMWKFEADGGIRSSPAVDGDRVFFLTESGILYGVNIYTRNYWSDNIGKCDNCSAMQDPENPNETLGGAGWSWSSPVVNNGYVFVASSDGYIHRLEASTGDRKPDWDKKAINYFSDPPHPNGPVTVFNGKVICGTHSLEKTIVAFDENSGEEIWSVDKYRYNSGGVAVADVDGNGEFEIYFGTGYQPHDDTGYFFSINESSPYSQNWSKYTGGGINSTPAIYDGKIFVGTSRTVYGNKGEFLILDAANGNTLATFRPTEFPSQDANNMWSIWSSPAVADGKVFFGATDHILYVLSVDAEGTLDENDLLWFHHTGEDSRIWTSPAIAYGNVYVADENGTVFAFSERVVNFWMTDDIEDGDCAALGDTITYAINYSYPVEPDADQTALEDVRIISYLPDGIDRSSVLPSDSGFYDSVENVVVWQIGTLERGDTEGTVTVSMNISETAPQGLRLTNNASIRNNDILLSSAMVKTDVCCFAPGIIYVDKKAMGLNSGRSWKDACTDLQNALQKTAWNCGSEIWVADGIYFVPTYDPEQTFVIPDGVSIYGGFKGTEKTINERDIKSSSDLAGIETVLHGSYIHNYVVTAQGDSVINGFTIAGGFKAGVLCNNSAAKIVNCWIVDNGYENDGDAGVCITGTSTANILNCVLTDNYGHGIYISDTASPFIR